MADLKGTEKFKETINEYLLQTALIDPLFAPKMNNPDKNINDCITYILNTVQESGCNGFTDAEVFGMALHYYDEDKIDVGKEISMQVVVNHHVELTDDEKKQVHENALKQATDKALSDMTKKTTKKVEVKPNIIQQSLF